MEFLASFIAHSADPLWKVSNFVHLKLTVQAGWPYKQNILLSTHNKTLHPGWPYNLGPYKRNLLYIVYP